MSLSASLSPTIPLGADVSNLDLTDVLGQWNGTVSNNNDPAGDPTAYNILLTINDPDFEPWKEIGTMAYPSLDLVAPLQIFYPVECVEHIEGRNPVGRCFQVCENFYLDGAVGYPGEVFGFGMIILSLQEDGTMYYMYQNGVLGVTATYLEPLDAPVPAGLAAPATSPFHVWDVVTKGKQQDIMANWRSLDNGVLSRPKGSEYGEIIASLNEIIEDDALGEGGMRFYFDVFRRPGRWVGAVEQHGEQITMPVLNGLGDKFEIELQFEPLQPCTTLAAMIDPEYTGSCGQQSFRNDAGLSVRSACGQNFNCGPFNQQDLNIMIVPIRCVPSIRGANPVDGVAPEDGGRCFQFWMPIESVGDHLFDPLWYSVSLQTDGSLYWQANAGILGVYDSYLSLVN